MLELKIVLDDIENKINEISFTDVLGISFKAFVMYNKVDDYLYLSLQSNKEEVLTGFNRILPNVDYFDLNTLKTDFKKQLRFAKVNNNAKEKDRITKENIGIDYKLYIFEDSEV